MNYASYESFPMKIKRILVIIFVLALLTASFFFFFGKQGLYYLYQEQAHRSEEIRQYRHTIDSLRAEIGKLTNDTAYIERIAREKLGMARPNEKVYKFIEKGK